MFDESQTDPHRETEAGESICYRVFEFELESFWFTYCTEVILKFKWNIYTGWNCVHIFPMQEPRPKL